MKQLGNLCYEREVMSKARCAWTGRCCECLVSKSCLTLCDPWTVALQAPLSMEFSRQKYWSGLPFPSPGRCSISTQGSDPCHLHWQAGSLPMSHQGSPQISLCCVVLSCSAVSDSCDPMDYNSPGFSVWGFSRQEYLNGLPHPPSGDLSNPRD